MKGIRKHFMKVDKSAIGLGLILFLGLVIVSCPVEKKQDDRVDVDTHIEHKTSVE